MTDNAFETIEAIVKKVPKDEAVWANLYVKDPFDGSGGRIVIKRDKNGNCLPDFERQLVEHLEEGRKYRGPMTMKVKLRGPQEADHGSVDVTTVLRPQEVPKARVENPAPAEGAAGAVDPLDLMEREVARERRSRLLRFGACPDCKEPKPDCVCVEEEEDCKECHLPESECQCDAREGILDIIVKKALTGQTGDDLANAAVDTVRALVSRIRHGPTKPPPEVELERAGNVTLINGGKKESA